MADTENGKELLRAQAALLLSQARTQSAEFKQTLGTVHGNAALAARLSAAIAQIAGVSGELSQALGSSSFSLGAGDLMALQAAVMSGDASALAAEAQSDGFKATVAVNLANAAASTRSAVETLNTELFERHLFDASLRFDSAQDKADFRQREADTQKYVQGELARNTAEGNLNAAGGMQNYMLDAHAHGAGDNPEFMPRWNALAQKTREQRAAMHEAGQSTDAYDAHVKDGVRRFLKAKGLPDADIEKHLNAADNPLDALPPHLSGREGGRAPEPVAQAAAPADAALHLDPAALAEKLAAGGWKMTESRRESGDALPDHGLGAAKAAAKPAASLSHP